MAYTKTRGTCCAPPASQKPKTVVGLDRLNLRDADGRLSFKCERSDCNNVVEQSRRGRRQRFCSDRCRKAVARRRVTCPKNLAKAPTADGSFEPNFRTKHSNEINGLEEAKNDLQKASLFWERYNEVTWKLTDGEISRTTASFGQWGGYNTKRGLAWAIDAGWPLGHTAWYACCGEKSYGPTSLSTAKQAARALLTGAPLPTDDNAVLTGPVDLNRAALMASNRDNASLTEPPTKGDDND